MRYIFPLLFLLIAMPGVVSAEHIQTYNTEIDLNMDSSFVVTERIEYVFTENRHGIFRYIPTKHQQESTKWYKERLIDIDVQSVTMDGSLVPFEVSEESGQVFIKIGDPNVTISGRHIYEIKYLVRGGLSFIPYEGAELYWDVTGEDWGVQMYSVETSVTAPPGVFTGEWACYRGSLGSSASCTSIDEENGKVVFKAENLNPHEGVTVALAIDETKIEKVILENNRVLIFLIPLGIVWLLFLSYVVYRYRTKYRTGRSVIAQYEPYEDLKPMYTGLLFDGTLDPKDITAAIIYLAERGFLKIKKTTGKVLFFFEVDDYVIDLIRSPEDVGSKFQQEILKLLFDGESQMGDSVTLSDLKKDISKQKENQKILKELKKDLEEDLVKSGFFQVSIPTRYIFGAVIVLVILVVSSLYFLPEFISQASILIPLIVISVLSVVILSFMYRRRTRKGYEALNHLRGFEDFLTMTEKERYAFHNAPQKSPEQFMKYLPYAIAFGVEKEWAEVFKDVTIPDPTWYEGGTAGSFSATNLTTSLGAFSTAFAASSGSSGGASGGGSVGGGGGGGGGGSW